MSSNDGEQSAPTERIVDLEVRIAYLEHSLAELDKVVCQATDELSRVRGAVGSMQSAAAEHSGESHRTSLEEEVPPHY